MYDAILLLSHDYVGFRPEERARGNGGLEEAGKGEKVVEGEKGGGGRRWRVGERSARGWWGTRDGGARGEGKMGIGGMGGGGVT